MKLIHPIGLLLLSCISLMCAAVPARADIRREAEALVNWKASLASADESIFGSWSLAKSTTICWWPRITCNLAGHIIQLDLGFASLNGTLDELDFSAFPYLKELSLYNNGGLYSTIPAGIGNLTSLVMLWITGNPYLTGAIPRSIGQLKHLTTLYLEDLGLDGTLPEEIGNLTSLEGVIIRSLKLTGSIPQKIGMLTKLRYLELSNNNLSGSIPLEIGNMTELYLLKLSGNYLDGELPGTLSHLVQLEYLGLSENKLGGQIILELGNSSLLDEVHIGNNKFSGPFPSSICVGGVLGIVSAEYNGFTSIHPQTFRNCTSLTSVDFRANNIAAELRDCFGEHPRWLEFIDLSQNQLYGTLLTEQGEVLLCNSTNLALLDLSNNSLNGGLSECIGDLPSLAFMDLSRNSFSGVVPFSCQHSLNHLYLDNNHLEGTFPLGLQKCMNLITLDLGVNGFSGTIPSWISASLPELRFLRLSSNMFDGIIPHQILQFHQLQVLDLSINKLTGPIPDNFTNFTGMIQEPKSFDFGVFAGMVYEEDINIDINIVGKYMDGNFNVTVAAIVGIDLSCNSLSQEIPDGLTTLLALRFLNLSGNHLSGSIPKDFGNLALLESLDLSQNQLSGGIPPSFGSLKTISVLNLSYNGLSGRIPTGSQLQTLVDPSIYSYNLGLCGFPLEDCVNSSTSTQNEVSQAVDREELWVYCFVAAGFIFGFWLYWGMFLFYSETWRCAFYQYVDNLQGKVTKKMYSCMPCFQARGP